MKPRSALILFALGVVALAIGIAIQPRPDAPPAEIGQAVFPGIAAKLASAARIEIIGEGKHAVLLRQEESEGESWGVNERDGFPADMAKLRALFAGLGELRFAEPLTADPALFGRLGVDAPATPGSTATFLDVKNADGVTLASVIVGHRSVRGRGDVPDSIYLRRPGEARAWRAEGKLAADADPLMWMRRRILDIKADKIALVELYRDDTTLRLSRHGDALALDDPPPGKVDEFTPLEVAQALDDLTLIDARRFPASGKRVGSALFTTTDGANVAVTLSMDGNKLWGDFSVIGAPDPIQGRERSMDWLDDWVFELPPERLHGLLPKVTDFVRPEPPK
jgi:hypothetical protein